jgi:D-alanyl-D-alanine carboxypeptidase
MRRGNHFARPTLALLLAISSSLLLPLWPGGRTALYAGPAHTGVAVARRAPTDAELARSPLDLRYPAPPILGRAALLYDLDSNGTLLSYHADEPLPPASTTKLMTALLVLEHGRLDTPATVSYAAATVGQSSMGLRQGEVLTRRQLLYGLLLPSGNDAAVALAESIAGSQDAFVAMMNARCAQLGCTHTHFMNPHGLPAAGHYTSARDLLLIAQASLRFATLVQIAGTRSYVIPATPSNYAHDLVNIDQPIFWYPGLEGLKSGTTGEAGHCEVLYEVRGGRHLLAVLLGMPNRYTDVRDVLNFGLQNFTWHLATQARYLYMPDDLSQDTPDQTLAATDGKGRPERYYPATGYYLRQPFLAYAQAHPSLGAPTSDVTAFGDDRVQRFSHAVLIYHRADRYVRPVALPPPGAPRGPIT